MSAVIFTEHAAADGKKIIEICLNAEKSLNALTLEMVDIIQPKLESYKTDESVVAILLCGAGEKAFCAGGDIINLYNAMTGNDIEFIEAFFKREYILDHTIHTYPKPIICWGTGVVMGGGMGLMNGASHRVVTETTHMAMPEVTIGLSPDVGGTWFLHRAPGRTGLFLGLTGNSVNAADAKYVNWADRCLRADQRGELVERLKAADWAEGAHNVVNNVLRALEAEASDTHQEIEAQVHKNYDLIQELTDKNSIEEIVEAIINLETEDKWLGRAKKTLTNGSPIVMQTIYRQLNNTKHMSLKQVFAAELILSEQACRIGEFREGIRALLIDKDGKPNWTYKSVRDVDPAFMDKFFTPPWPTNPLASM